jgi:hypothetical protein
MIQSIVGAGARAYFVALLIAFPALMLQDISHDLSQIMALLALLSAVFTFVEYFSAYPSFIDFRNAPPFNRLRFAALFLTVLLLTAISRGETEPTAFVQRLAGIGEWIGQVMDFPLSPIRLMVLVMPQDASLLELQTVRTHAGLAYLISLLCMLVFAALVRKLNWPVRRGSFNFWVNLPLFDPTRGGDVIWRLKRDARFNFALGFLLPFLIPALMKAATEIVDPITLSDPHTLIWTMTAWAFFPASLVMRGIAFSRIAALIQEKRRRAYAEASFRTA